MAIGSILDQRGDRTPLGTGTIEWGLCFFILDSRRVLPRTKGAGIREQNTSQIQILAILKKGGAML